jgi:hypothetical protein
MSRLVATLTEIWMKRKRGVAVVERTEHHSVLELSSQSTLKSDDSAVKAPTFIIILSVDGQFKLPFLTGVLYRNPRAYQMTFLRAFI